MDIVKQFEERVAQVRDDDFANVAFNQILQGSNSYYEIRPTLAIGVSGQPYSTYGIFNVQTGVMETESRQLPAAKEWVQALTAMVKGEPLPQLNAVHPMSEDYEDDEEEGEQQELPLH